jgi:hypothetical protein
MGGQEWQRHVLVERLTAGLPNFGPRPLDAALIELRRVGAIRLLGIKQCSLRHLDQIVALHRTKRKRRPQRRRPAKLSGSPEPISSGQSCRSNSPSPGSRASHSSFQRGRLVGGPKRPRRRHGIANRTARIHSWVRPSIALTTARIASRIPRQRKKDRCQRSLIFPMAGFLPDATDPATNAIGVPSATTASMRLRRLASAHRWWAAATDASVRGLLPLCPLFGVSGRPYGLPQRVAPVDDEHGAGDEARRIAGEVDHRRAEFLWERVALHRRVFDPVPPEFRLVDR